MSTQNYGTDGELEKKKRGKEKKSKAANINECLGSVETGNNRAWRIKNMNMNIYYT